jgi:hypothetical protein
MKGSEGERAEPERRVLRKSSSGLSSGGITARQERKKKRK